MFRFQSPFLLVLLVLLGSSASCGPSDPSAVAGPRPSGPVGESDAEAWDRRVSEAVARVRESAVALEYSAADAPSGARRVATGVVLSAPGEVLSIRIDPPPTGAPIVARDASGRRLPVRWVAADPETGVTLLQLQIEPGQPARPVHAAPRDPVLGGQVVVIGNPFGLGHSVSRGCVAGVGRRLELGVNQLGGLIQIDAALHPGDSGALVADLHGDWLGLVRSGLASADRDHDHDLGFALPARDVLWVADQLRLHQRVDRAYLGVRINLGAPGDVPGALLDSVLADTPAARAGLQPGDRVVAFDGQPVLTPRDLTDRLDRTLADAEATLDYRRGDLTDRVIVHTASRPPLEPSPPDAPNPAAPPRADELRLALPRAVLDRLEQLERRLDALEQPERAGARP